MSISYDGYFADEEEAIQTSGETCETDFSVDSPASTEDEKEKQEMFSRFERGHRMRRLRELTKAPSQRRKMRRAESSSDDVLAA